MILVDTNLIIYYFNGLEKARVFLNQHVGKMAISTITVSEVLSSPLLTEQEITICLAFLENNFVWLDINREIIFKTAEIRRHRKIKTPDAIIAATAHIYDYPLASRNDKDFKNLNFLCYINPID